MPEHPADEIEIVKKNLQIEDSESLDKTSN
jgi:hypothetical protein